MVLFDSLGVEDAVGAEAPHIQGRRASRFFRSRAEDLSVEVRRWRFYPAAILRFRAGPQERSAYDTRT